jgi:hypothetical protein
MKKAKFLIPAIILAILFLGFFHSCQTELGNDQPADGKMMFWSNFDGPPIVVYVDGKERGSINAFFTETPSCESQGCVTVTMIPGTYAFHAEEQNGTGSAKTWDGSVTIRANGCGTLALTP